MFGFLFGLACAWGLVRVVRGKPLFGYHGPWRNHWGEDCGPPRWRHRRGRDFFMRGLFDKLDTTAGQEKEIRRAIDEVTDAARALKDDVLASREDLGRAFRHDDLSEEEMAALLTRHDDGIDALRKAVVGSLARIHAALDADQREKLASWLTRGPRWGGPYRSWA